LDIAFSAKEGGERVDNGDEGREEGRTVNVPAPGGPMRTILGAPATAPVTPPTADLAESIALETAFPVLFSS